MSVDEVPSLKMFLRLTNYLGAAQLYLRGNFLLKDTLKKDDIKRRILGHWGTVPGLNLAYACTNMLVRDHKIDAMFIAGRGMERRRCWQTSLLKERLEIFTLNTNAGLKGLKT